MPREDKTTTQRIFEKMNKAGEIDYLTGLKYRWSSEKNYEDFNDYRTAIKKNIKTLSVKTVTKSPFGFTAKIQEGILIVKWTGGKVYFGIKR